MPLYEIRFKVIYQYADLGASVETTRIRTLSRSQAIDQFYRDMTGYSFEIIDVTECN